MLRLLERSGMLTKGMPTRELDWEAMWRAELAKDDTADADGATCCLGLNGLACTVLAQHDKALYSVVPRCQ